METCTAGWFSGCIHILTLDGASYSFNGLGEYVLSQTIPSSNSSLVLQCRTAMAAGSTTSTAFVAFAIQQNGGDIIQLNYNSAWNGIDILINGVNVTTTIMSQNATSQQLANPASSPAYQISAVNSSVTVTNSLCSMTVSVGYLSLSATFNMPSSAAGLLTGLLGNFDGNANNDYMMRNGTLLAASSMNSQLFQFGQSCK